MFAGYQLFCESQLISVKEDDIFPEMQFTIVVKRKRQYEADHAVPIYC